MEKFDGEIWVQYLDLSVLCRSRREFSKERLIAKAGVNTGENESPSVSWKSGVHTAVSVRAEVRPIAAGSVKVKCSSASQSGATMALLLFTLIFGDHDISIFVDVFFSHMRADISTPQLRFSTGIKKYISMDHKQKKKPP